MNRARLLWRNLLYFRATHLGVLAGVAIGATVLTGALLVGDSVQATLRQQALQRIGGIDLALAAGEHPFRRALADDLQADLAGAEVAAVLQFAGVASSSEGDRRALDVQLLGVDQQFFRLAPTATALPAPGPGEVWLNRRLAAQLHSKAGERIVVRIEPATGMPREALLGGAAAPPRALALRVGNIVDDHGFGSFALDIAPLPPQLALVSLPWLQAQLGLGERANLILIGGAGATPATATAALRRHWQLADAGMSVRALPLSTVLELDSDSVLLDPHVVAATRQLPQPAMGVFTWLATELRTSDRSVPYALVAALGPASAAAPLPTPPPWRDVLPANTDDDGIVISSWLQQDLHAGIGDAIEMRYWRLGAEGKLTEASHTLRIAAVVERAGLAADRELMPPFPGIATAASCREWQPGVPIDYRQLRDRDEQYWRDFGGTPKAFVTLATGQALWGDARFGALTALRFEQRDAAAFLAALRQALDPAELGLVVRDVRTPALLASTPATDFSAMFLGLSMFLIAAAVLLAVLVQALGVLQRSAEIGTLLAIGFRPATVRQLLLAEAAALAAAGAFVGAALAAIEARLLLAALDSIWADAVAGATLSLHVRLPVLLAGGVATFAMAMLAAWLTLRRQVRQPAVQLLAQRSGVAGLDNTGPPARACLWLFASGLLGSIAALLWGANASLPWRPAAAFLAGTAVLLTTLAGCRLLLADRQTIAAPARLSLRTLAWSNTARRPSRSLAAVALLACGSFLVVVVGANHRGPPADPTARDSGTGGFALLGRSALPVVVDRTAAAAGFRLAADQPPGIDVVPLRVHDGDEASCRSLGRPQQPRLLGVRAEALAARGAFAFGEVLQPTTGSPWLLLRGASADGAIPAIGDAASITWSLHRGLGDVIDYTDEQGRSFGLRIVATLSGSILQGSLLIDETSFLQRFPSTPGYRKFLVDAEPADAAVAAAQLMRDLADVGLELVPASQRLRELDAVQNTWLSVFQCLGGLGLVLGSLGLGVVLLRNVVERRGEVALLLALGWRRRTVRWLLVEEHALLLLAGAGCGVGAALLAVAVQLRSLALAPPMLPVAVLVLAMLLCGLCMVWLAAKWALGRSRAGDLARV